MKITIIGAGNVGAALAKGWGRAGHAIRFGVRAPDAEKMQALRTETGAVVARPAEACDGADVIVLALPWGAAEQAVASLGDLVGKIVVDCMNPLAMQDGRLALDRGFTASGGEAVASWLPDARIVKTLNQVGANIMADTTTFSTPPVMFLAGDDDDAKAAVATLLSDLGFEPLDAGDLRQSRLLEPFGMVWINQSLFRGHGRDWAFAAVPQGS